MKIMICFVPSLEGEINYYMHGLYVALGGKLSPDLIINNTITRGI